MWHEDARGEKRHAIRRMDCMQVLRQVAGASDQGTHLRRFIPVSTHGWVEALVLAWGIATPRTRGWAVAMSRARSTPSGVSIIGLPRSKQVPSSTG